MAVKPMVTYNYTDQLNDDDVFIAAGEQVNTINALNASNDINNKAFGGYDAEANDSRIKSTIGDALSYAVDTRVAAYSSGDIAHITNGIKNGLFKSIKTSFNPTQKNKYDTTWIGGGDINKMPSIVRATKTGVGTSSITCQVIAGNGVVRLTGEQGSTATTTFRLDFKDDEKRVKLPGNGTWQPQLYLHLNNSVADSKITVSLLYTPSSSTGGQRFNVALDTKNKVSRINTYGIEGARLNRIEIIIRSQSVNFSLRPMITRSEENEAWRPFSNVCAINGYSGVTFTRCGKNLLEDPQNVTVEAQKDEWTKYPICVLPLLPKGTYRLSYTQDKDITTNYYNRIVYAENGYSHSCPASLNSGRHSVPITVRDSSQVEIEWEARNVSDECHITDFQLEYADASSEYAEYEGDAYSVEFKIAGTSKKEYRGSFDLITGELVVTGALVTLGDYYWRYNDYNKMFICDHFADVIKTGRNKYATDILCSSYTPYSGSGTSPDRKYIRANLKNGYIYIFDPDYAFFGATPTAQEIINRQNEFKASLASTTTFIPFAEPSIHRYSPATVKSFLGINNIWSDIGDIDVTYPLDLKAYVDHAISQYSVQTVSGPIAHYTNNFKRIPTKSVKVDIEPVQAGSGDPSPDNVRPISGWTGAKVTRTGKNLLNFNSANYYNDNIFFGGYYQGGNYIVDGTFTLKAGTYTASANANMTAWYLFDETGKIGIKYNNNVYTFTLSEEKTICLRCYMTSIQTKEDFAQYDIQLELGSTATDYEPYSGQAYNITFPTEAGTVYGGTLDVTQGVLTVDRAMVFLNGTEYWSKASTPNNHWRFFYNNPNIKNIGVNDYSVISNLYPKGTPASTYSGVMGISQNTGNNTLFICDESIDNVDDFKAFLSANNVQACILFATPITYQLTPQEITSLLGTNNLWADTGDIEVKHLTHTEA